MRKLALDKCVFVLIAGIVPGLAGAAPMLYVGDTLADSVKVIDTASNTIVGDPIAIPRPLVPSVSPDGALVYVQSTNGTISVIDAATRSVVRTFDDPNPTAVDGPATMTLSPDGSVLYAIGTGDGAIALVDTNTGSVSSRIPGTGLASNSPLIRISHDGQRLFVLDAYSLKIAAVDVSTRTITGEVSIPSGGQTDVLAGFAIAADDRTLYATTYYGNLISIDTTSMTVSSTTPIGSSLGTIDLSPDGTHAFVAETGDVCLGNVALATGLVTATGIAGSTTCFAIAAGRDGRHVYLGKYEDASGTYTVVVLDTAENSAAVTLSGFSYPNFDSQSMGPSSITPEPGTWWNPAESGRSFMIEVQHGTLVLVANVYDDTGAPIWLTASGPYDTVSGTFSSLFASYRDGQCLGCPYRTPVYMPVTTGGEVSLEFSSATTGTLSFDGVDSAIQKFEW